MSKIKNIAIIAHVDHGKTTLVDAMLRQTGVFRENQVVVERVMDSNDIEKERGITIFSKNAAFTYGGYKVNIVDTPGHADFGGEVQRIMKMADSVLLLVDAFEGPMPQTKYVLKKSLELGLRPVVVINKIDRPRCRPEEVLEEVFDLFLELDADDKQLDFPVVYASARDGIAKYQPDDESDDLTPLFETIIKRVPDAVGDVSAPVQFLVSAIEYDNYIGRIGTGKIHNGTLRRGAKLLRLKRDGSSVEFTITKLFVYEGLLKKEVEEAFAGDIVSVAGAESIDVGETIADPENPVALPSIEIDRPTLSIEFMVNDSPFVGMDGKNVTSRHIWDRLQRELQSNVSIKVEKTSAADSFTVKGRGELQLAVLIENMRREGFELQLSKPRVITREIDGRLCEPFETAFIDVGQDYAGIVIDKLGKRKGEMLAMAPGKDGNTRMEFRIPSRGLLGYRNEFITDTRGTGILNHTFLEYAPHCGEMPGRVKGALVAMETGVAVAYGIANVLERGVFFIKPGDKIYAGMVVGAHSRESDLIVNVCKTKKLTNMRASGTDDAIKLPPSRQFTLELGLEYINEDELMEVTPSAIRVRKKILDHSRRKRFSKN
ncbi:translational GTPase TypA [bacterium]|nr:translational GTPase TypA [Candidatus Omnitrophota bacterium]MBU2528969.1 translational GTPase TypA [bacterium]MBU3930179.1 translational GTPase TypA [bacterium]MBU4122544.1 translational GTPase TypA [bacterium]